ncbi:MULTISPECIES: hypothetical protein [unclassified Crossiella]|uniref:hypothetical protein n=1 Tax=unclassified Crossiella TaxID=2620835 RepID=UPI001FFF6795|nr:MULTISPECIES: hypothetical protein [unclassified Crossiella]MCK2240297.1 hypothetical protein [Crossiella sp. S99.2]MCK2253251.1 hypothetical protein [Crossiella sp. S99.1]
MISTKPPGPSIEASEAELRLRWLRAHPLLVLGYVIIPGFAAALVVTLVIFGFSIRVDSAVGLVIITGGPLCGYVWGLTRKPEWWLTPTAWARRAFWLTALVCFAMLPATGYWSPIQWWVWPLVLTLCVLLPTLSGVLAGRARRSFLRPFSPDLGECGFVLFGELNGIAGELRLELTELRWKQGGSGEEVSLLLKQIEQVTVGAVTRDSTPSPRALGKPDGSGGAALPPGRVMAVQGRKGTILFPLKDPEAFAAILERRMAARPQLIKNARVTM